MRKLIFILIASAILMLSCNDALYELKYEYDCGCAPIDISNIQDIPFSWINDIPILRASASTQKEMTPLDMERIFREDMEDEVHGVPPRFGYRHSVNYNLENSGEWITLPDGGRLWRLTISSPGALSINLLYDQFWMPDGAKFWIYSTDRSQLLSKLTSENNSGTRDDIQGFATGLVFSDQITLEYFLPSDADEVGFISVVYVVHGYRNIRVPGAATRTNFGASQRCHINVNCAEGAPWRNERNAVALILVNGYRGCTGFLVNTTANDGRPLFMTANHCVQAWGLDAVYGNSPDLPHWSFVWHFESPTCADIVPTRQATTAGAKLIANNFTAGFALLDLSNVSGGNNRDPRNRANITPYFLGWDRSGNPGASGVGIHHPMGDIKKISLSNSIVNHPSPLHSAPQYINGAWRTLLNTPANTTWRVTLHRGFIESGTSGSPFINNNRRVIGQALAVPSGQTCATPNPRGYYGRFDVSWYGTTTRTNHSDHRRRLNHWLAPGVSNPPQSIAGLCPRPVVTSIEVPSVIRTGNSVFTVNHSGGTISSWGVSPNHGVFLNPSCNKFLNVGFTHPGNYTVTVTVTNACGTSTMSRNIVVENIHPPIICPFCGSLTPNCPRCPHPPPILWGDPEEEVEK